jgi:hypothetical protein
MSTLARWLLPGPCPICGEPARFLRKTCGDLQCRHRGSPVPPPDERLLALMFGLVGGLLMGGVIGYVIGAGWWS